MKNSMYLYDKQIIKNFHCVLVYDKQYIIWRITVLEPESRLREWKEKVNN